MSSLQSVEEFGTKFRLLVSMRHLKLHLLFLNAGAMFWERELSKDGLEMTFASNHLGHFCLVKALLPHLLSAEGDGALPRVILTGSSTASALDHLDFSVVARAGSPGGMSREEMLQLPFDTMGSYAHSKLAGLLFAQGLVRRLRDKGSRIPVCVVHPGEVYTDFARNLPWMIVFVYSVLRPAFLSIMKTPRQGCQGILYAAASADVVSRSKASSSFLYIERCGLGQPNEAGCREEDAEKLWVASEQLVSEIRKCSR